MLDYETKKIITLGELTMEGLKKKGVALSEAVQIG